MLVVITGASKGIGFELVKQFSSNSDFLIIAISRNTKSIENYINTFNTTNILSVKADITKEKSLLNLKNLIKNLKKPVFALINNAGLILNKDFLKIKKVEIENVYATNLIAPFLLTQTLVPFMGKTNKSHVVNISSMGGFQGSSKFAGLSAYSSSKSALSGLTECLAEELKTKNISVNCLAIGAVQTEMLAKAFPGYKTPLLPNEMATFIYNFTCTGHHFFNGKILPVSSTTP
ncbi:MAG: SDR family oxidoreductase [Bacteroidetes bacterium]|nr:SDR family oxidoreductase [Bacteroidota bacterium]